MTVRKERHARCAAVLRHLLGNRVAVFYLLRNHRTLEEAVCFCQSAPVPAIAVRETELQDFLHTGQLEIHPDKFESNAGVRLWEFIAQSLIQMPQFVPLWNWLCRLIGPIWSPQLPTHFGPGHKAKCFEYLALLFEPYKKHSEHSAPSSKITALATVQSARVLRRAERK